MQGPSKPEFYGGLVFKLKKIVGTNIFSVLFSKIISHYKNIGYNRLHAWWSSRLTTLLSSLMARWQVGPQTLWQFRLNDLSMDERVGAWCCILGQAHRDLTVGFLLVRYSVVCTVESVSLFYILFISWCVCTWRWCIDKVGFLCKPNIYLSWSISELWVRLVPLNIFKLSSVFC